MKKLISLLLVMIMMCACVVSVGAYSSAFPGSDEYERLQELEDELTPIFAEYFSEQTNGDSINWISILSVGNLNNEEEYVLVYFNADSVSNEECMYRLGEFAVVSEHKSPLYEDGMAVYTKADGEWHSLSYIYETDIGEFMTLAYSLQTPALIGCVTYFATGQKYIDIKIATEIQKYLAGIEVGVENDKVCYLDFDNDGDIAIKDATAIQKYIAGLEVEIYDSVV